MKTKIVDLLYKASFFAVVAAGFITMIAVYEMIEFIFS